MKDYTKLFGEVYFYSKEYEAAKVALDDLKARGEGESALLRAERDMKKLKEKLDSLCSELPEEIPEKKK